MIKGNKTKKRVVVGMSGGVDSAVSAALLKEHGYDVVGVFMHFWQEKKTSKIRENLCCSLGAQEDARRVCQKLDIPFYTMNMDLPFKKNIVDTFIEGYKKGQTPNPCVVCNREIKFGEFIKRAEKLGAQFVATGHYARIRKDKFGVFHLLKGRDLSKDQTYFLHQLNQKQLSKIIFPIGDLTKPQVRILAEKYGLSVAHKKESQEVCFIPDGDLAGFLRRYNDYKAGHIQDFSTKKILGQHQGLSSYTLGQRKGIGLGGGPWYVVKLDTKKNILWVSTSEKDLQSNIVKIKSGHWIKTPEKFPLKCKGQIRYRSEAANCVVEKVGNSYQIKFVKPQRAITPGQYAVFWKGQACLGGGEIQ